MGTLAPGMSQAQTCPVHWGCRGGPGPHESVLVLCSDCGHPPHCAQPRRPAAHGPGRHEPGGRRTRQGPGDGRGHFGVVQAQTGPADVGCREQAQWLRSGPTHVLCSLPPSSAFSGCRGSRGKGQGQSPGIIPERANATVLAPSLDCYWAPLPRPPRGQGAGRWRRRGTPKLSSARTSSLSHVRARSGFNWKTGRGWKGSVRRRPWAGPQRAPRALWL